MNDACVYADQNKTGYISMAELRKIAKSFKMPIQDYLLQRLLQNSKRNDDGDLAYDQFIGFLNWRDNPGRLFRH